jgi:hypothetical protein
VLPVFFVTELTYPEHSLPTVFWSTLFFIGTINKSPLCDILEKTTLFLKVQVLEKVKIVYDIATKSIKK